MRAAGREGALGVRWDQLAAYLAVDGAEGQKEEDGDQVDWDVGEGVFP